MDTNKFSEFEVASVIHFLGNNRARTGSVRETWNTLTGRAASTGEAKRGE